MAAEADTPDPISLTKREVEDREFTSKFLDVTANIALEEKKKVESWISKPPETIETLEKIESTQANDIVVAGVNFVTKSIAKDDNFLQSPLVDDGRATKNTEENQLNITEELSGLRDEDKDKANNMVCDGIKDGCTSKETACLDNQETEEAAECDEATKNSSVSALTENTSSGKEGLDAGGNLGENSGMEFEEGNQEIIGSSKKMKHVTSIETTSEEASQEIETNVPNEDAEKISNVKEQRPIGIPEEILRETRNDETIISDDINKQILEEKNLSTVDLDAKVEIPNKNSIDLDVPHLLVEETVQVEGEKKDEVPILKSGDQLNITEELSGMQDEQNEKTNKMLCDGIKDSCTSKETACLDNQETKEVAECNEPTKDSSVTMLTKDTGSRKEGLDEGGNLRENSSMEFQERNQEIISSSKKMKNVTSTETPLEVASQEIETNVPSEDAETITNVKEQRPVGIPEEILHETRNEETIISDDINKKIPEEKNFLTVDLDAEVEIPNKNSNDLDVPHLPVEETVHVGGEKQNEVSISESGDQLNITKKLSGLQDGVKDGCTSKETTCPYSHETEEAIECDDFDEATKDSSVTVLTEDTSLGKKGLDIGGNLRKNSNMEFEEGNQEIIGSSKKLKNITSTETQLEVVASQEIETNVPSEDAEKITNVKEQRLVGIPKEILQETINDEIIISDDINKQIPEEKNLSTVDFDAKVEIPNKNSDDLDVLHLPVEETVRVGGEKQDKVSISESGDQLNIAEELSGLQDEKNDKADKMLYDGVKVGCTSKETACPDNHETKKAAECDEATKDSSIIALAEGTSLGNEGLDAGGNLGENSSMEFEEGNQKIIGSSKKMKNVTSTETPLEVTSREIETNVPSEYVETIIDVKEQKLVGIPETRNDETIISEDINKQIPEEKNLLIVDLDAKVEIPSKNSNDLDVPHLLVEETVQVEGEKQDEVFISKSGEQVYEGFEVPREEEKHVDEMAEASKNPERSILEHISTGEAANIDKLVTVSELNSEEQLKEINNGDNTKEETKQKEKASVEMLPMQDPSTADLDEKNRRAGVEMLNENDNDIYVTYPPIEETKQVKGEKRDEVSTSESGDQVDEAFRVPEEEEKNVDEPNKVSESPKSSSIFEHTSTEAVNIDTLGKDCELNTKEELKEINTAENIGEEREQKEKAADKVFHVTRSDDNEKCTFEEDVAITNTIRLCSGEEADHHEQEYKNRSNSPAEATSESDSGDQRFKTSYETKIVNDQFINNEDFEDPKTADRGENTEKATKSEGDTIRDQSPKSTSDDAKKCSQENEMEAKCKPKMGKELGITSEGECSEKKVLADEHKVWDWNTVSAGEELQTESSKDDAMTTKMPNQEVFEVLQTADGSANVGLQTKEEDGKANDKFAAQEETKNECFHEEVKEENEPDTKSKVLKTNHGVQDTAEQIVKNSVNIQSADYFEEKTVVECSYKDESNERYMAARTSMTMEESATTDLPSSLVGEKIVKESLKEDERNSAGSEEEVCNSNTGCREQTLKATRLLDEREDEASKEEAKPNEGPNTWSITGSDVPNESNLDYIENSTMPEISGKEVLEKKDSKAILLAEKTILIQAEAEYIMQTDSSNLVSEEKDLVPAETTENGSSGINRKTKPEESSNLVENEDEENPTATKHGAHEAAGRTKPEGNHEPHDALIKTEDQTESATAGTSTDDTAEQNLRAFSTQEHKFVTAEVNEQRGEAPEKDKISFSKAETSLVAETTEENIMEMEGESTYPKNKGSTDIEECANGGPGNNKELYPLPELNNEKNTSESDVELFKSVNTSEIDNWTEIGKLKTSEDEKLSDTGLQNEKSEWEMEINEASKEAEGCSRSIETKMAILEQEDSTENYEGASKESIQIKKATVELQAEDHSHGDETLTSKAKSTSGLPKRNIKSVEHGENPEFAPESVAEDISERRFSETNQTNTEEESYRDDTPAIDFPTEQISGQDIQEGKDKINEETEPKSNPQKETNKIEYAIVTRKVCIEIERDDENEINKGQTVDEESCTRELHAMAAVENKVCIEIERDDENEINKGQTVEEESCTRELHATAAVENKVTELDPSANHSLEATTVNDETEMVKSKIAEDSKLIHEHEKEENESITINNSDANAMKTEETKIPNKVSESKDQVARDIHQRSTSIPVGDTDTNKIENQREDPEALSEPINQGAEAANADEIIAPPVVAEVRRFREVQLNDEPVKALETSSDTKSPETTNTVDINQQKAEVNSMKLEVEETKIPDVEEIQEMGASLTVGETETNESEKQIREIPEALPEPINQGVEASGNDKIAHGQTVQFEKTEEQVKLLSSVLLSDEENVESTTIIEKAEDGCTKKDDTNAANLKVEGTSGIASQLLGTQFESASNLTMEKLEADEVKVEETKTLDSVSEPRDQGLEEIHGTWTRPTAEIVNADKMEEDKEVTEKISDSRCQCIQAVAEDQIPDQAHPVDKLEQQLQTSSSALMKLVEATSMVEFPTSEHKGADNMKAATEKLDEDEVQLEAEVKEAKTVEQISEFKVHGVEEIQETRPSPTVEKTQKEEVEAEIKAIPEKISAPNHQGDEAIINENITLYRIPPIERKEQLQEPSFALLEEQDNKTTAKVEMIKDESTKKDGTQMNENVPDSIKTGTTEKLGLQDEVSKEHEVSNLDQTEQDTQNGPPEEESTALEEVLDVKPQEYNPEIKYADSPIESEKTPVQCCSQDSSKDEEAIYSGNSNKESDNLPPHATVKELVPGEVGKKCGETPSLEFDNTRKVLEYVSEIKSPDVPLMSEGAEIKKEQLEETTTKSRDGENLSEEINEADEAMKEDTSKDKIMEEKQVLQNSRPVSPHEETVTKNNQEDLEVECYPEERTNEKCAATRNEIQQGKLFEESERGAADKTIKETTIAKDRTVEEPDQISVGAETANISCPEEAKDDDRAPIKLDFGNRRDETNFEDAATAPIKEVKSSGGKSVKPEEDKTGDNNEETEMAKGEQLQNKYITASEEAQDEKTSEIFEEVSVPASKVPTHETIEMHEENKEIAEANTNNSESLVDHEKMEHKSLEQACDGNGITEGLSLKKKEACANKPSISSSTATLQEETSDKERESTIDEKQREFMPDKQTDAASILGGMSIQTEEERTMDEETVQISTIGPQRDFDEAKTYSAMSANEDDKAQHQYEELNFLSHTKDSERSHEKDITDLVEATEITKETQVLKETSLSISHEHIARKEDPSEGTETTNSTTCKDVPRKQEDLITKSFQNAEIKDTKPGYASRSEQETKGLEYGEEKKMGEECQETTEKSTPIDSATISLSELLHRSTKETLQVAEHLTEERELIANKKETQTETAETAKVEEAKTDEEKNEEVDGDEHKKEDSGSDAPVMVEALRDADVKITHKKSHNILSGVGSKVKHSIAKVKKAITGKSSHPKTPLPK